MADLSLVCMRLAKMVFRHPEQDNSRVCGACNHPVGIFPSGQRVLAKSPHAKILCMDCAEPQRFDVVVAAPGAAEELAASNKVQ